MGLNLRAEIAVLVFLALLGIIFFLLITNTLEFKDKVFNTLYPKSRSYAIEPSIMPDEILIKFKKDTNLETKSDILNSNGLKVVNVIDKIGVEKVKVEAKLRERVLDNLRNDPNIEFAEPNFLAESLLIPNIPESQALDIPTISPISPSVVVAVVDTGLKSGHQGFEGKFVPGFNTFLESSDTQDTPGHGTAVARIASAALQNPIMPIRDSDNTGLAPYADMAEAIIYATDQGAKVINISQGGANISTTLQSAIDYSWSLGALVVASAGDIENSSCSNCIKFPANAQNVISVGALDSDYSARGPELDFVAPGFGSGTSLAAPFVSGLIALIWSVNPSLTNQQVFDIVKDTADDLGTPGWDDQYGWGKVNAGKAFEKAKIN